MRIRKHTRVKQSRLFRPEKPLVGAQERRECRECVLCGREKGIGRDNGTGREEGGSGGSAEVLGEVTTEGPEGGYWVNVERFDDVVKVGGLEVEGVKLDMLRKRILVN